MIPLEEELSRWVELGLISDDQAVRIRAVETGEPVPAAAPEPGPSLVGEALGYVGGALVVVASLLLVGRFWEDLGQGARLALVGSAAALLVGVGFAVPAVPGTAGARLRSAVWALSTAAWTGFVGLLAFETLDWEDERAAFTMLAAGAAQAAVLWSWDRAPVQQVVLFVGLCTSSAWGVLLLTPDDSDWSGLAGVAVVVVSAAWILLGVTARLRPRELTELLGALGAVIGATVCQASGDWGRVVALLVLAGVIALAVRLNRLLLLAVATLGMFLVVPNVVDTWFPGEVAAPLALLVSGAVLVLLALRAARSRPRR